MSTRTYRYVLIEEDGKRWWPAKGDVDKIISEMERYGPNCSWVLCKALARAREGREL